MDYKTPSRTFADIPIYKYETIDSTQNAAKEWLENSYRDNKYSILSIHSADNQTGGRGRLNRSWDTKAGSSLACTFVVRPVAENLMENVARLISSFQLAISRLGVDCKIKWPNDLIVHNKKIGGCLTEIYHDFLVVGIGINLKNDAFGVELKPTATSLEEYIDSVNQSELLDIAIQEYIENVNVLDSVDFWKLYKNNCFTIGQQVKIETIEKTFQGKAVDIQNSGALVLEINGENKIFYEGDIIHLRAQNF